MNIDALNDLCRSTMIEHLGVKFIEVSGEKIVASMPVDQRTKQPMGILHGGASMMLAETVGSAGSFLLIDSENYDVVGIGINGNHIGSVSKGYIIATATLIHKGEKIHVWDINIKDETGKIINISRLTNMILAKKKEKQTNDITESNN